MEKINQFFDGVEMKLNSGVPKEEVGTWVTETPTHTHTHTHTFTHTHKHTVIINDLPVLILTINIACTILMPAMWTFVLV